MHQVARECVTQSFELAAERCADLTPLVYERLFREQPQMRRLFVLDADDAVKGSMLAWTIRAILDLAGAREFGHNLIQTEAVNHFRNGVAIADFPIFFRVLAQTMQAVLAADWSPAIDAAWRDLLAELDAMLVALQVAQGENP